ncbi:hypothetical protein FZC84_07035 [Rossellomorea vietnamensis]|uniref:Uncharacterized protein n=2 Tax=Bacillaceae TaxID=186817 RepID=A0A5D4MF58_9BACI|nr:hypothetical protein [Rossellomorea vietnamensis]TYS00292.1 hypothetical protein FZC84_07035 [Rossellomorea vietnamensis]
MLDHIFEEVIAISDKRDRTNVQKANQQLNDRFYQEENSNTAESKTEKANKEIHERLESGESSKGVDPDRYLANNENSLVTEGVKKKK